VVMNDNGPRLVRLGTQPSFSHSQYEAYLARTITKSSPDLLQSDTWDRDLLLACLGKSLPAPAKMKRGCRNDARRVRKNSPH
jgi:hypothetical protein